MREILFRGKFEPLHSWIYGDLAHKEDGEIYIVPEAGKNNAYPVDPETVGQYTGLRDKNSNKIFEGDVVRYQDDMNFVVRWSDRRVGFMMAFKHDVFSLADAPHLYEIIGNIYDNPELMEGENDE